MKMGSYGGNSRHTVKGGDAKKNFTAVSRTDKQTREMQASRTVKKSGQKGRKYT